MLVEPVRELITADGARRDAKDHTLRVVDGRVELLAVEHKKHFERRMPDALVAVDEGVVPDERESERCGLAVEHFGEREEPSRHGRPGQASRRYNSAFFSMTCAAAST